RERAVDKSHRIERNPRYRLYGICARVHSNDREKTAGLHRRTRGKALAETRADGDRRKDTWDNRTRNGGLGACEQSQSFRHARLAIKRTSAFKPEFVDQLGTP